MGRGKRSDGVRVSVWLALAGVLATSGCGREPARVYRAPKENLSVPAAGGAAAAGMPAMGALPTLRYTVPDGWKEQAPAGMRVARFTIANGQGQETDISVIPLPGMKGSEMDVLNLWRESLQLPVVSEIEVAGLLKPVRVGEGQGRMAEMVSTAGTLPGGAKGRIIAAIIDHGEASWFFKMMGEDGAVGGQRDAFVKFLESVKWDAPAGGGAPAPVASAPTATGAGGGGGGVASGGGSGQAPVWDVPQGWVNEQSSSMAMAGFAATDAAGKKALITVTELAGDGGGNLMNINRWRGQLGLAPWSESDLAKSVVTLDSPGGKVAVVDLQGTDGRTGKAGRIVGAIVLQPGKGWFYKMTGEPGVVGEQKAAFEKFVMGVRYP